MSKQTEREELTAHTPGNWHVEGDGKKRSSEIEPQHIRILSPHANSRGPIEKQIAVVYYGETDSEREANARLIAAAPELLAENKRLRALVQRWREVIAGHEKNAEGWAKEFESESRAALAGSMK